MTSKTEARIKLAKARLARARVLARAKAAVHERQPAAPETTARIDQHRKRIAEWRKAYAACGVLLDEATLEMLAAASPIKLEVKLTLDPDEQD